MGKSGYHRGRRGITCNWTLERNWRCRRCRLSGDGWHGCMGRRRRMGSPGSRGRGMSGRGSGCMSRPGRGRRRVSRFRRRSRCMCRLWSWRRSMSRRRSMGGGRGVSWCVGRRRCRRVSWRRSVSRRRGGSNCMCSDKQARGDCSYRAHQGKDEQHEA